MTDSASPAASATTSFTLTISPAASLRTIAEIQGAGATTPFAGEAVVTQGVVTAAYPTGGLNGFDIQTPGEDTTPGASDGFSRMAGPAGSRPIPRSETPYACAARPTSSPAADADLRSAK